MNEPITTPQRAWAAEGARVAIVTCLECGAALLLDTADPFDVTEVHANWHAALRADMEER